MTAQRFGYPGVVRFLTWVLVAACTKHNPSATCPNGTCSDPRYPYCDKDGVIGGVPGDCIQVTCNPGDVGGCDQGQALVCNTEGDGYQLTACNTTCIDTPAPHCAYLQPRYAPDICDAPATAAPMDITNSGTLDTGLDANCNGGIVPQTGAADLCVMRYKSIVIEANQTVTVIGPRALSLVADDAIMIAGTLDIGATGTTSGPGAAPAASGTASMTPNGAGGAGAATAGAPGGNTTNDGGAVDGGPAAIDPAQLSVLVGGAPADAVNLGGGGGGGAATLIACRGEVSVSGTLTSGGGGGVGGALFFSIPAGGFGGGAGGYFVLQGISITVTGDVYANGGGGGAGMQNNNAQGAFGKDGRVSSELVGAQGGTEANGSGRGGAGGCFNLGPQFGGHLTITGATSGGGGGSMGFLQSYTPANVMPTLTPVNASPMFRPNGTVPTR